MLKDNPGLIVVLLLNALGMYLLTMSAILYVGSRFVRQLLYWSGSYDLGTGLEQYLAQFTDDIIKRGFFFGDELQIAPILITLLGLLAVVVLILRLLCWTAPWSRAIK